MSHVHFENSNKSKRLLFVTLLNGVITLLEAVGGVFANSLALLSDAVHNLSDTAAIVIAYGADRIGRKNANERFTFGYQRAEILSALFNSLALVLICLFIFYRSVKRFYDPEPVAGVYMMVVASIGLAANWLSVILLKKDKKKSLNLKAVYLHLLGDTLSSVLVVVGGLVIIKTGIHWIDPLISILLGAYILFHSRKVLKESFSIILQAAPENMDIKKISEDLNQWDEIKNIHHAHLWNLTDSKVFLEAHLVLSRDCKVSASERLILKVKRFLKEKYHIHHVTLQMEFIGCPNRALIMERESEHE